MGKVFSGKVLSEERIVRKLYSNKMIILQCILPTVCLESTSIYLKFYICDIIILVANSLLRQRGSVLDGCNAAINSQCVLMLHLITHYCT